MEITNAISSLLNQKQTDIWSVSPDTIVYDAIKVMSEKNVGALLVLDDGKLVGVLSERDYTRKIVLKGLKSRETPVRSIMTDQPVYVSPEDSVDRCMRIMTQNRVRHLPVLSGGKVVGVVSIGDLVNWIISAQTAAIDQLEKFISGEYPA
jgi:CBS domain-containing protein